MKLATSQPTHGIVDSTGTVAMRHATMRLTAIGGVNCPTAIIMVRITPNHTGSHAKAFATGTSNQ